MPDEYEIWTIADLLSVPRAERKKALEALGDALDLFDSYTIRQFNTRYSNLTGWRKFWFRWTTKLIYRPDGRDGVDLTDGKTKIVLSRES